MIASAGVSILVSAFWENEEMIELASTNWSMVVIFLISFFLLKKAKLNPIFVMVLAGGMKAAVSAAEKFL